MHNQVRFTESKVVENFIHNRTSFSIVTSGVFTPVGPFPVPPVSKYINNLPPVQCTDIAGRIRQEIRKRSGAVAS